jgi:hypothetical protein
MTTKRRRGGGLLLVLLASGIAVVVACGSDPKKDPATSSPTASGTGSSSPTTSASSSAASSASSGSTTAAAAPDAGGSGKSDKQTECDALLEDANSTLDAERIQVDKQCKKDTDCMPIKGRACGFVCVTGAIPKVEEKDWTGALTKVKDGPCKKWEANECAKLKTKPPPTCTERKIWCDKGHCALKDK